jgi:hypothetical protein
LIPHIDLIEHESYTEVVFDADESTDFNQYKNFSTTEFFETLGLSSNHFYSEYFKKRLHELCIQGVVRPEQFGRDINFKTKVMVRRGGLRCLSKYAIKHDHIDTYRSGFIINFNNYLRRNNIKLAPGSVNQVMSDFLESYSQGRTGHWVIYKTSNGKRYYLDVCEHDADEYLVNTGLKEYLEECPNIF